MAKLMQGIDLGGRTLTVNIPNDVVVSENKVIAWTDKNNSIAESYTPSNDVIAVYYVYNGVTLLFYQRKGTNAPTVNWGSFKMPDEFGVITEVDETAAMFPYIARNANEKAYLMGEDKARVEGYSKDELDAKFENKGTLLASGFSTQGAEKTFSVAGYNWLIVECLVSINTNYGMTAPPFVVPLNAFPNKTGSSGLAWTVLGRNNNYLRIAMYYNESAQTVRAVVPIVENGGSAINMSIYGMR